MNTKLWQPALEGFQKVAVRGNYETRNQAFSMRLRFLTTFKSFI
jgi:hypothetical protein